MIFVPTIWKQSMSEFSHTNFDGGSCERIVVSPLVLTYIHVITTMNTTRSGVFQSKLFIIGIGYSLK